MDDEDGIETGNSSEEDNLSKPTISLTDAARIKPLQGEDGWTEFDEKSQGQVGVIDLYNLPTDRRRQELLLFRTDSHPESLLYEQPGYRGRRLV